MSFDFKSALALLEPQAQAQIFAHLAERLHQPSLDALAQYYQALLEEKFAASPAVVATEAKQYRTSEEQATAEANRVREEVATYGAQAQADPHFEELYATFDGEVFKPENKIELEPDKRYRLLLEKPGSRFPEIKNRAFREIAKLAVPMGIRDLAEQHDHYLYGTPKRK